MKYILLSLLIFSQLANASEQLKEKIKKFNWNGIEVIYLQDDKFPVFSLAVYFADGALSDHSKRYGETEAMFNNLIAGTNRYDQKQIADSLEFFGSSLGFHVTHEYSVARVSGLTKNLDPVMKMACHVFKDATFPKKEIKTYKSKLISGLKDLVSSHSSLAERVFRQVSLDNTIYENPTSGYIKSVRRLTPSYLKAKRDYFTKKVKKRIYLTGPKDALAVKENIEKDCGWSGDGKFARVDQIEQKSFEASKTKIVLVPVKKANQAQVRIGKLLGSEFTKSEFELMDLAAGFLGGGFTSPLMQELRVKRGLTYGAYSYASNQKTYGRAGISTSTKNKTVHEIIDVTQNVIEKMSKDIPKDLLENAKGYLTGSYLFKFESSERFLENLLFFDHVGRDYSEIYNYPKLIKSATKADVERKLNQLFNKSSQTIVVVGSRKLLKQLKKFGVVKVIGHNQFL